MDFLQDAKVVNVIPSHAAIAEGALYVIESGELEFNNIIRGIGLEELAFTEATGEVKDDKSSIKKIIDSVIAWLKDKWEKVRGLFESFIKKITDQIDKWKSKIDNKMLRKVKARAGKLKDVDSEGKAKIFGKTYEFTNLDSMLDRSNAIWEAVDAFNEAAHGMLSSSIAKSSGSSFKNIADTHKNTMLSKIASTCGVAANEITAESDMIRVISNYIRGAKVDVDKKYIVDHVQEMFELVTDKDKSIKSIKKLYNESKKEYNKDIANLKKEKKDLGADIYMACVKAVKDSKMASTAVVGAILSNVKAKVSVDTKIIMKLCVAATVKESADVALESSSYETELVSLFQW